MPRNTGASHEGKNEFETVSHIMFILKSVTSNVYIIVESSMRGLCVLGQNLSNLGLFSKDFWPTRYQFLKWEGLYLIWKAVCCEE